MNLMDNSIRFIFLLILLSIQFSCSNSLESEKQELLISGLEQSADFSENFLNFYYENDIERTEAEYPDYLKETAANMRKIWYFYQEFDAFYSDTTKIKSSAKAKIYSLYKKSLDSLNTLAQRVDTNFVALDFDKNHSILYKNHLENAKNILLRKLIRTLPNQIETKKYYAFQVLNIEVSSTENSDEVFLSLKDMQPKYRHKIMIDSVLPRAEFSVDTSLIFGKIKIDSHHKGIHSVYGKIQIIGQNGLSYIPFYQSFELY